MKKIITLLLVICLIFAYEIPTFAEFDQYAYEAQYNYHIDPGYNALIYSTFVEYPTNASQYNCYAYALGITTRCLEPGFMTFTSADYTDPDVDVYSLEPLVLSDLHELGNNCVVCQINVTPTYSTAWENIIALRMDTTMDFRNRAGNPFNDFHFAKLTADGWYHKPGDTAILKFNNAPSVNIDWYSEYVSIYYGYYYTITSECTYDSDIIYFLYRTNHVFTSSYVSNGASSHEAYCVCGEHISCGHTLNYTYTNQYYHGVSCSDCSYSAQLAHDWVLSGIWYRCSHCTAKHRADSGPLPSPYALDPVTE